MEKCWRILVMLCGLIIMSEYDVLAQNYTFQELLRDAESGIVGAQNAIAIEYINGQYVQRDYKKSAYWFRRAAEQGSQDAMVNLGRIYAEGLTGEKNDGEAIKWFTKAVDMGLQSSYPGTYQTALYYLGITFENQDDIDNAMNYYSQAIKCGDVPSMNALGKIYIYRLSEPDYEKGFGLIKKSAEAGYPDAQNTLGCCYQFGQGVQQNDDQAFYWYKKAFDNQSSGAIVNLGACYSEGRGVKQNYEKALELYRKAADLGETAAYIEIGRCYLNGEGVPRDVDEGLSWFETAARNENPNGYLWSGIVSYEKSYGKQDYENAVKMFRKYVEKYNGDRNFYDDYSLGYAYRRLSTCYRYGRGVPAEEVRADEYLKKAREYGDKISEETLKKMMKIK